MTVRLSSILLLLATGVAHAAETLPLVGNVDNGKQVAEKQCAKCHGLNGVAATSGAPFIAGLTQEYQVRSLIAYQNGSRNHGIMKQASDQLNPITLADVTAYYASLKSEWHGAIASHKSRAIINNREAIQAAKHIVDGCLSCHSQTARHQKKEAIPNLNGMPLEYFAPAYKSYFHGGRDNQYMKLFKRRLTDEEIYNIGAYYAAQKPVKAKNRNNHGNAAKGKIAARACAGCHGYDGNSLSPFIPNLAGHSADYLIKATTDYRDGKRNDPLMSAPTQRLSDISIANLAAYYSQQTPESPLHKDLSSEDAFNPLKDGTELANSCNSCHGEAGNSTQQGIPNLTGLSVKYLVKATQDYQMGRRQHSAMQEIVSFYSDTDIEKVAYYYASQTPADKTATPEKETDTSLISACENCHGKLGISADPNQTPSLAGQDASYIVTASLAYASGKRRHDGMKSAIEGLDKNSLEKIAAVFAEQQNQQVTTYLPDNPAEVIKQRCTRCHGEDGLGDQRGIPRLAGQLESYLVLAMKEYQDGIRKDKTMHAMTETLSLLEIKAIAAYYAKQ